MASFGDGLSAVDSPADLVEAGERAALRALEALDGDAPDLVCLFVATPDPDLVAPVAERVTEICEAGILIGCGAAGVIGGGSAVDARPAVSVWAAGLPGTVLSGFHLDTVRTPDSVAVLGMPETEPDTRAALLLADPYTFPADGFVARSNELFPGLPIVGGLAVGGDTGATTRLVLDTDVYDSGAVGLLIGGQDEASEGSVQVRTVVSQGCRPIGPPMVVTRSAENVLLELAGTPALTKLEQIVAGLPPAERVLAAQGLHIGIVMDEYAEEHENGDFLVRQVLGVDTTTSGVVVGDVIEVGQAVRFHVRDAQAADEELRRSLTDFRTSGGLTRVDGALLFSCNGRAGQLFETVDHDVRAVRHGLVTDRVAGFFAAGEIGPVAGRNHVHGFTASILAFGPAAGTGQGFGARPATNRGNHG